MELFKSLNTERDSRITFDEPSHRYCVDGEPTNFSVTGFLGVKMYDSFDAGKASCGAAKKLIRSDLFTDIAEAQAYVQMTYKYSCVKGTRVHKFIEWFLNKQERPEEIAPANDEELTNACAVGTPTDLMRQQFATEFSHNRLVSETKLCFDNFMRAFSFIDRAYTLATTEYIIWHKTPTFSIAGSVDAIFWSDIEKREVVIMDWKTNKTVTNVFSSINKNEQSPFFQQPCDVIKKYSCQLHIYSQILESHYNVKVVDAYLVHLSHNNFTIISHQSECPCREFFLSL